MGTVARATVPSLNVMPPDRGVPSPELTVPVKVTDCLKEDGFFEETTPVDVDARFTVCPIAWEDARYFGLPVYCAVMVCAPAGRVEVLKWATPLLLRVTVPSTEAPS